MAVSTFDLFSIGIGPSSSHTVGPMRAAGTFVRMLQSLGALQRVAAVRVELFGSLGATGRGHGSDKAVIGGLAGRLPESVDPEELAALVAQTAASRRLPLAGGPTIAFSPQEDLRFCRESLPYHPNAVRFTAADAAGAVLAKRAYYSIGGGFVVDEDAAAADRIVPDATPLPHPFTTAAALLARCDETGMPISELMLHNEQTWRSEREIRQRLLEIWNAMQQCVQRGCRQEGVLPGGLRVERRAAALFRKLQSDRPQPGDSFGSLDWVNLWALAVNEENAAGGRVVTAPTNGAAGILPAVLHYFHKFRFRGTEPERDDATVRFLLTAAAIGILFKENASISGAEVGCQGEVGSACSMAAGALAEVLGGTPQQVENAAEIGMEHNLGLTCDPVGGLVQVPCIERNAMAAVKAINAARLALCGDGRHRVSLDKVIKTMRDTGRDMKTKYKETARGGLAVNVTEC